MVKQLLDDGAGLPALQETLLRASPPPLLTARVFLLVVTFKAVIVMTSAQEHVSVTVNPQKYYCISGF